MLKISKLLPRVCLLAAAALAVSAPGAFAGHKWPIRESAYDPVHHAAVTTQDIGLYSFRWLHARTPLSIVPLFQQGTLRSHGVLAERKPNSPLCQIMHHCIQRTNVGIRLTHLIFCPAREISGFVYTHLYVRPLGQSRWHELPHYHDVVVADCR